jgi:hypothetical protein
MPGYLGDYHAGVTSNPDPEGWLGMKLHPEAANWVMGLSPQNLTTYMRGQGLASRDAMSSGQRLNQIQRAIQQKGYDIGTWEAYNAPYGPNSALGHTLRGVLTPSQQAARSAAQNAMVNQQLAAGTTTV